MLPMLYGFSVASCLSSALSEPGGMGLGTLGFSPGVAERMCREAGFAAFQVHDFKDPANLYYECTCPGPPSGAVPASTTHVAIDLSATPGPAFCRCHSAGPPAGLCRL